MHVSYNDSFRVLSPVNGASLVLEPHDRAAGWKIDEIERELRAQLALAKRHIPNVTYRSAVAPAVRLRVKLPPSHCFGGPP